MERVVLLSIIQQVDYEETGLSNGIADGDLLTSTAESQAYTINWAVYVFIYLFLQRLFQLYKDHCSSSLGIQGLLAQYHFGSMDEQKETAQDITVGLYVM